MVDYKLIGKRIKEARVKSGQTQETVSERADITVVYLSKIENGKVKPTLDTLNTICNAIECDLGSLFINSTSESSDYQNERVIKLYRDCSPSVKPIVLDLLESLSKL